MTTIPLQQLALSTQTPRRAPDDLLLEELIAQFGIRRSIVVCQLGDRLYEVIDGERRVYMAKELARRDRLPYAKQSVPCVVVRITNPQERALWRLVCNTQSILPEASIRDLLSQAGVAFTLPDGFFTELREQNAPTSDDQPIDRLLVELTRRKTAVRGGGRVLRILEIARAVNSNTMSLQAALDALRWASVEE